LESKVVDRLIVSTDDSNIAAICEQWGAEVPFIRPPSLALDQSTSMEVMDHALDWWGEHETVLPEVVLLLQPTSPFRTADDIRAAVNLFQSGDIDAVVSVCVAPNHPHLMSTISEDGLLMPFMDTSGCGTRRQDLPPVYAVNGAIYLNSLISLKRDRVFIPPRTKPYFMPPSRSLDIDDPLDFCIAEALVKRHLEL